MIIRIALASPFGLGIFSSLMLIAGKTGYAVAFVSYLAMMAALALKPPAALARRLGMEVDDEPTEEKEPSEPGEGLLATLKTLPALVIAFVVGLSAKLPFIGKKDDAEEASPSPAAPAPDVATADASDTPAEATPAEAPVLAAVAETEEPARPLFALLAKLKFWGKAPAVAAAPTSGEAPNGAASDPASDQAEPAADDDEGEDDESLMAPIRAVVAFVMKIARALQKREPDDMANDDLIAAAAGGTPQDGEGKVLAFPAPAKTSLFLGLLAKAKAISDKVVVREPGEGALLASTVGPNPFALAGPLEVVGVVTPIADADPLAVPDLAAVADPLADVDPLALDDVSIPAPAAAPVVAGSLMARLLAVAKAVGSKVFAREGAVPGTAMQAALATPAKADGGGGFLAKVVPGLRSLKGKLVVTGDAAVAAEAKPRRPLKESLALVVPTVMAGGVAVVTWARGLRKDDYLPMLGTAWRVGGMAVFLLLALPFLAIDLWVMRKQIRKEEMAEALAASEAPDPGEVLLDTLVGDETPEAITA
jgi:hypothetical protein